MTKERSDIVDLLFDKYCKRMKIKTEGDYYYEIREIFHAGYAACEDRNEEITKPAPDGDDGEGV